MSQGSAFFALCRRQPWRRRARPPWNASFLPSTLSSCLLKFGTRLQTPRAHPLALTRPATTTGPLAESAPVWRLDPGVAPCLGRARPDWLGPKPRARPPLSPSLGLSRPSVAVGQLVSTGRPSSNRKFSFSVFLLLFGKRNDLKNVCILKFAPNLLKQIFARFLVTRST